MIIVVSVNIEIGNVVAQALQVRLAARLCRAARVRRAHVGWEEAKDVAQSHLVLPHLVLAVHGRDSAKVQMGPCVAGNLMAVGVHPLDNRNVSVGGDINLAFP